MAKARKILKHIRAVRNIRNVTKTMEMVATSRFKRSRTKAVSARRYTDTLSELVAEIVSRGALEKIDHPLLHAHEDLLHDVMVIITSNRGLCGGYNSSVLRTALARRQQVLQADYKLDLYVCGKRGIQQVKAQGLAITRQFTDFSDLPDWRRVSELTDSLIGLFLDGLIGGVEVAYTQFLSAGRQRPVIAQMLPVSELASLARPGKIFGEPSPYEFTPSAQDVLAKLLPSVVRVRMYQSFLDAAASEHVARMTAMRAATDNAEDMIRGLTLRYNRKRQAQITYELAEIIGGRSQAED